MEASPGEIATAKLNASELNLVSFLSSYGIQMNIVQQDKVVGKYKPNLASSDWCLQFYYPLMKIALSGIVKTNFILKNQETNKKTGLTQVLIDKALFLGGGVFFLCLIR